MPIRSHSRFSFRSVNLDPYYITVCIIELTLLIAGIILSTLPKSYPHPLHIFGIVLVVAFFVIPMIIMLIAKCLPDQCKTCYCCGYQSL